MLYYFATGLLEILTADHADSLPDHSLPPPHHVDESPLPSIAAALSRLWSQMAQNAIDSTVVVGRVLLSMATERIYSITCAFCSTMALMVALHEADTAVIVSYLLRMYVATVSMFPT